MAQLAIKGHADRGDEVIKILKLLRGKNTNHNVGKYINSIYFINNNGYIEATSNPLIMLDFTVLTLEEVEVLMPYKIGDKVLYEDEICEITGMRWHKGLEKIIYDAKGEKSTLFNFEPDKFILVIKQEIAHTVIRLIKEETIKDMDEKLTAAPEITTLNMSAIDYNNGLVGYEIPAGYEFDTVIDNKVVLKKLKLQYPKTYKECYEVLMGKTNFQDFALIPTKFSTTQYKEIEISSEPPHINLINNFYKLLICRDAYWKIAGEQMGLGKTWKPDYNDCTEDKYFSTKFFIYVYRDEICPGSCELTHHFIVFPTAEMREAFYENFKDLIEECKELL